MRVLRGLGLFVAGAVVGLTATTFAQNQTPNQGIVGLNHVGLSVPDLDKAVEYYTKTMGFPEAFRFVNASGQVQLVYVQVSQNTFVELQPANAQRPPGITHFGLHVENMAAATAMFKARGAAVGETTLSGTRPSFPISSTPTAFARNWPNCRRSPFTGRQWNGGD